MIKSADTMCGCEVVTRRGAVQRMGAYLHGSFSSYSRHSPLSWPAMRHAPPAERGAGRGQREKTGGGEHRGGEAGDTHMSGFVGCADLAEVGALVLVLLSHGKEL